VRPKPRSSRLSTVMKPKGFPRAYPAREVGEYTLPASANSRIF